MHAPIRVDLTLEAKNSFEEYFILILCYKFEVRMEFNEFFLLYVEFILGERSLPS